MVICAAVGCGNNSNTSIELNISLYRLPREEKFKTTWKKNYGGKSCRQMKISGYAIYILKKNVLNETCKYTVFICPLKYSIISVFICPLKYSIILANLARKV